MKRIGELSPMSTKRRRAQAAYNRARHAVRDRAGGMCEVEACHSRGDQAHHRRRRSQGGDDTPANLLWVCSPCHDVIHANPAWAEACGYLIRSLFDPDAA
jgi:hypothetical protein